ncbi:MAG: hypothetical protein SFY80_04245 [Verrucomicrobiota bacterium]|nr:hypothetical protein [Verrucomicrobiota bacterium]
MLIYVLLWFIMLIIAVINGALREGTYGKVMPELRAHQLSTAIGGVLMGAFMWFVIHTWRPSSQYEAIWIGILWVSLTILFEFFMGLVLRRLPLGKVLSDYNLRAGRIWPLLLLWIAVAPCLIFSLSIK